MKLILGKKGNTLIEGDDSKDDTAHASDLAPDDVVEGSSDAEDGAAECCVPKKLWVKIYHQEI